MQKDTASILIETTAKMALKRMQEDPERTIRNLVDMALNFTNGRFQRHFFELAQTCLQKQNSPYYDAIIDTVLHTDPDRLLRFGMNVGYNGCTAGAKIIRELEAQRGYNIPWTVFLQMPDSFPRHSMDRYQRIIRQGEEMGIRTWMLFAQNHCQCAFSFAQQHPDSAFVLFCDPKDVTMTFLDIAGDIKNLMVVPKLDENTEAACSLLRSAGMLYSVFDRYSEQDVPSILNGSLFQTTKELHPAFTILIPQHDCREPIRDQVYELALSLRKNQTFLSIPFDLYGDCRMVDEIISEDACLAGFDKKGNLITRQKTTTKAEYNLLASDLPQIFQRAFPKAAV